MGGFAGDVLQTGSSNIGIGYGADFGSSSSTNAITLGVNIESSSNDFSFGKASNVVKMILTQTLTGRDLQIKGLRKTLQIKS